MSASNAFSRPIRRSQRATMSFRPETLDECFSSEYIASLKISPTNFSLLAAQILTNDEEFFGMTPLAIRMCRSANGVSEKHGEVSRDLWLKMFPELEPKPSAVPITSGHKRRSRADVDRTGFSKHLRSDNRRELDRSLLATPTDGPQRSISSRRRDLERTSDAQEDC